MKQWLTGDKHQEKREKDEKMTVTGIIYWKTV